MNIQDLKSNTTWQEASNTINNNNNKISIAIATLENVRLKNKGYFTTVEKLNEAIPNPTIGSKAYVGTSEPYAIYIVENGSWVDSGYTGGNEIVAKITTDRIENGAVTSEKIATSAFDDTLSVSGKIAPADVVGAKLTELDGKTRTLASDVYGEDGTISEIINFTSGAPTNQQVVIKIGKAYHCDIENVGEVTSNLVVRVYKDSSVVRTLLNKSSFEPNQNFEFDVTLSAGEELRLVLATGRSIFAVNAHTERTNGIKDDVDQIKAEANILDAKVKQNTIDIQSILTETYNYEVGKKINQAGTLADDASMCVSEEIPVSSAEYPSRIRVYSGVATGAYIAQYDADHKKIDTWGITAEYRDVVVRDNAVYLRFSFLKEYDAKTTNLANSTITWQKESKKSVEERLQNVEDVVSNITPIDINNGWRTCRILNPKIDIRKEVKGTLKVLDIGNSFTNYPTTYLSDIINNAYERGEMGDLKDIAHYNLTRSGSSFSDWYKLYHNQDYQPGAVYYFTKITDKGNLVSLNPQTCPVESNALLLNVMNEKWDIILIHQRSVYSAECDEWEGNTDGGYLKEFIAILKRFQPQATIGFTFVHSVSAKLAANKEHSTLERWKNIGKGVAKMQAEYGIDFIIPWGTALENLRASSYKDAESELTADLTHPALGLATYACGLVYFESIYGMRYGVSLMDDTYSRDMSTERASAQYPSGMIDINDTTRPVAKLSALLACYDYYCVKNPEEFSSLFVR